MSVSRQAVGDILYASSTTQLGRIAAVATGQVLTSAGTGTVPAWSSNLSLGGTLDVAGAVTLNDAGADVDFRVESDDNQNMLLVDGGEDRVGIGVAAPLATTHISKASANVPTSGTTSNAHLMLEGTDNAVMIFGEQSGSPYGGWIQQSDKSNYSFNYPLQLNPDGGDVYSVAWTDYYASSTIVGWSSLTAGRRGIYTKRLGDTVWVWFHLEGTSNATTISFTLPYASAAVQTAGDFGGLLRQTYDNTTAIAAQGKASLDFSSSTVNVWKESHLNYGTWTASGSKIITGDFWYIAAAM